jgi:hypothetical protein
MSLGKEIMQDALVEHLRLELQQTINDLEALTQKRREIVANIANTLAVFKVGDVIIGDKNKPMKITRVVGVEQMMFRADKPPTIEVIYQGYFVRKDGTLGVESKDTKYDYVLGANLRLAMPEEIPQPKQPKAKADKLRAPGLDDGESPFHPQPGISSAGEY